MGQQHHGRGTSSPVAATANAALQATATAAHFYNLADDDENDAILAAVDIDALAMAAKQAKTRGDWTIYGVPVSEKGIGGVDGDFVHFIQLLPQR